MSIDSLLSDPTLLEAFVNDPANDLTSVTQSPQLLVKLLQIVISNQNTLKGLLKENDHYQQRVTTLENEVSANHNQIDYLTDQLVEAQQYSRRNTAILTGIPYEHGENIEGKVIQIINDSKVLSDYTFTKYDVTHISIPSMAP